MDGRMTFDQELLSYLLNSQTIAFPRQFKRSFNRGFSHARRPFIFASIVTM
jgi:hypothetical protein